MTVIEEIEHINKLRLIAFKSNSAFDKEAYYLALSKWFQNLSPAQPFCLRQNHTSPDTKRPTLEPRQLRPAIYRYASSYRVLALP
jgi:hypothetical protein